MPHIVFEQIEERTKAVGDWREPDTPLVRHFCFACAVRQLISPKSYGPIQARILWTGEAPTCHDCHQTIPDDKRYEL